MEGILREFEHYTNEHCISTILAEHPELRVLWQNLVDLTAAPLINGENFVLHVCFEAMAEAQITGGDPPEAKETAERLKRQGYTGHAARAAVAALLIPHFYESIHDDKSFDREGYARRLRAMNPSMAEPKRNEPCVCGSGQKFKRCCLPLGNIMTPSRYAGRLVLGYGAYAEPEKIKELPPDDPLLQLENRFHVARFLAENGLVEAAGEVLEENISLAEKYQDGSFLKKALQDLLDLCLDNKQVLGGKGLQLIGRLLEMVQYEAEKGAYICDRADILAVIGRVSEAHDTFYNLFETMPQWHFGRYRYALFLLKWGSREEALEILKQLTAEKEVVGEETYSAARELLEALENRTEG